MHIWWILHICILQFLNNKGDSTILSSFLNNRNGFSDLNLMYGCTRCVSNELSKTSIALNQMNVCHDINQFPSNVHYLMQKTLRKMLFLFETTNICRLFHWQLLEKTVIRRIGVHQTKLSSNMAVEERRAPSSTKFRDIAYVPCSFVYRSTFAA